jgi:hypothetical protein
MVALSVEEGVGDCLDCSSQALQALLARHTSRLILLKSFACSKPPRSETPCSLSLTPTVHKLHLFMTQSSRSLSLAPTCSQAPLTRDPAARQHAHKLRLFETHKVQKPFRLGSPIPNSISPTTPSPTHSTNRSTRSWIQREEERDTLLFEVYVEVFPFNSWLESHVGVGD